MDELKNNQMGGNIESQKELLAEIETVGDDLPSADSNPIEVLEEATKELTISDEELKTLTDTIPSLNFIELHSMMRDISQTRIQLEDVKTMTDSFLDVMNTRPTKNDDTLASKIQDADLEEQGKQILHTIGEDADDLESTAEVLKKYYDEFDRTMEKIAAITELIESTLHEKYDDVKKTTSFLTTCTVEMLEKRIAELPERFADGKFANDLRKLKEIFETRTSIEWLSEELSNANQNIRRLYYDLKKDTAGTKRNSVIHSVCKEFGRYHSPAQMQECEKLLKSVLGDEVSFYLIYALYSAHMRQMNRHRIEYKYIEMFIINCSDIQMGLFDLEDGVDGYKEKIITLGEIVKAHIPNREKR